MLALFGFSLDFSHHTWFNLEDLTFTDSGDELYLSCEETPLRTPTVF